MECFLVPNLLQRFFSREFSEDDDCYRRFNALALYIFRQQIIVEGANVVSAQYVLALTGEKLHYS